jgi:oligo-alginate lyase
MMYAIAMLLTAAAATTGASANAGHSAVSGGAVGQQAAQVASGYQVVVLPSDIAPTAATQAPASVQVVDQPRQSVGHPCTLWDQQDVDTFRKKLSSDKALQDNLAAIQARTDKRIGEPLGVPDVSDKPPTSDTYRIHGANAGTMSDLATLYAITGDAKYGEYCKQMILAYAAHYSHYPHQAGWTVDKYGSANDGRLTGQFLEDGFWLIHVAFAYDLVHNLPSWTPEQRTLVHDGLLGPICAEFYSPVEKPTDYINSTHNRSALCTAGVLMAGYACDDQDLVKIATYGEGGSPEHPTGGIFGTHFSDRCILDDGLWNEGAPAYQLGIVSCALIDDAETLWRHGIDMYSYRHGALKRLIDSALILAYPDPKMDMAALHDSAPNSLLSDVGWWTNEEGIPYECGYEHYRDPRYIPIVRNANQSLSMTVHAGAPSRFPEIPADQNAPPRVVENANFFAVGYGVLRLDTPQGPNQLIMEFGPSGGHAHPSKLGIDLFALGDALIPYPGVIFPYQDPMDPKWYWTTLANCAVSVDSTSQIYFGDRWKFPKSLPDPEAQELVFGPASTMGIERGWSDTVYPGITQDRALFLTPQYVADLFGSFSDQSHSYDMAWHFRGKLDTALPLSEMQFPAPVANGYNGLTDVRQASGAQPWSATITTKAGKSARLWSPGGAGSQVVIGNGHFFIGHVKNDEHPPTIIERLPAQTGAIFASAVDISNDAEGYVKGVTQAGSLSEGFSLLKVQTRVGVDLCFAAYAAGIHQAWGLKTDAQQALVRTDAAGVSAMYLAGGTTLEAGGAGIGRSEPGLAYIERTADGKFIVANPSPTDATIRISLPAASGLAAFALDETGKRVEGSPKSVVVADSPLALQAKAGERFELARQ